VTEEATAEVVLAGLVNGSASGFARTMACPASVVLPQASRTNEWAERGHELHRFLRAVLTGTPADAALLKVSDENRETASKIDFRKLGGDLTDVRCEAAYAINPRKLSARLLGLDIGRDYTAHNLTVDEVPGSDDIEGMYYETPAVLDAKFGFERVAPAEDNIQLKLYCAARAWITGAEEVEGRICYVKPSGNVQVDSHLFDRFELDAFAMEAERTLDEVAEARRVYLAGVVPQVNPGEHCKNCGAIDVCPAQVKLARAMVTEADALGVNLSDIELRTRIESLTLEQAGAAWKKMRQIGTLLDRVETALKARAAQYPLPLGNGKEVRPVTYEKESFVQARALQMLRDKGATEGEISTIYRTTVIDTPRECAVQSAKRRRKST
jgi:CRISPR/Cas system-associated exonuclease Cas4 (RecB family)